MRKAAIWFSRGLLALGGVTAALLIGEIALRIVDRRPPGYLTYTLKILDDWKRMPEFELDADLGYRPVLGPGHPYDDRGIRDSQPSPTEGLSRPRVLFLGDSVTDRGKLIEALRREYGDRSFEYLNAGVEGYDVPQEVGYYRRFARRADPTVVVLTFHVNDLQPEPMFLLTPSRQPFWYFHGEPAVVLSPLMLKWSYTYRRYARWQYGRLLERIRSSNRPQEQTAAAIQSLAAELSRDGKRLEVVFFPLLVPLHRWGPEDTATRDFVMRVLPQMGATVWDLGPVVEDAARDGIIPDLTREQAWASGWDPWHPDDVLAARMGSYLHQHGLLAHVGKDGGANPARPQ